MGTIIVPTKTDTTKTTCIEITSESYKCIDISAFVPQCITITSNVPTSDLYQEQYDREEVEITEAPMLKIALINNETPILNVNMDEDGVYYVTDFDTVYIDITNWNANAEYVNVFSNEDGNEAVVFLDEAEQRIIWALDDWAFDGTQMWLYAQAKESDKLISPQSSVTVMQMEQTDQPYLSSWVSATEKQVINIEILNYDETHVYSEPEVTGGTAVRTDNIIAWTLPYVSSNAYHKISITATAPLMYESAAGVSGGTVYLYYSNTMSASSKSLITAVYEIYGRYQYNIYFSFGEKYGYIPSDGYATSGEELVSLYATEARDAANGFMEQIYPGNFNFATVPDDYILTSTTYTDERDPSTSLGTVVKWFNYAKPI